MNEIILESNKKLKITMSALNMPIQSPFGFYDGTEITHGEIGRAHV